MSPSAWTFATDNSDISISIRSRLALETAKAAIDAANAGIGITRVLSYQIVDVVQSGVLEAALGASSPVGLVYAGERILPFKLRAFLDFAAARLKAALTYGAS